MKLLTKALMAYGLLLLSAACYLPSSFAQSHFKAGTTGANTLETKPGTRPSAMGGAFVALADDFNAVYYNPAGLGFLTKNELQFNQNKYLDEALSNHINLVYPLKDMQAKNINDLGVIAGGFSFVDYGKIAGRDESGADTGEFGAKDRIISVAYGKSFSPSFAYGVVGREIREEIYGIKAKGYSFDGGILFNKIIGDLNVGLVAQNVGNKIGFEKEKQPLPTSIVMGTALNLLNERLTLAADLNKPVYDYYYWNFGSEYWLNRILALRFGHSTQYDIGSGLSYGLGISLREFEFSFVPFSELVLNYAYKTRGDLGSEHSAELLIKIGVE